MALKPFHDFKPQAEINITPFVDVLLVLLVIFIALALSHSKTSDIRINLPTQQAGSRTADETRTVSINITSAGAIELDGVPVSLEHLKEALKTKKAALPQLSSVQLHADRHLSYQHVIQVMSRIRQAGILTISLMTHDEKP